MDTSNDANEVQRMRTILALLRITLGVILLYSWYENLTKGVYTADGITGLFNYIFNDTGGGPAFYRNLIESTILQSPGTFATFQLVAELLLGLGLLFGGLTPLAGAGATLFFLNLFLAYFGGNEWIWTYVLLTSSALVVTLTYCGRALGLDRYFFNRFGPSPLGILW